MRKSKGNLWLINNSRERPGKALGLIKSFFFPLFPVLKYLLRSQNFVLISREWLGFPSQTIKGGLQRNTIQMDEKSPPGKGFRLKGLLPLEAVYKDFLQK